MSQFQNTATAASAMRLIRKSLAAMKARQYQIVAVCGIMDTEQEYQVIIDITSNDSDYLK